MGSSKDAQQQVDGGAVREPSSRWMGLGKGAQQQTAGKRSEKQIFRPSFVPVTGNL